MSIFFLLIMFIIIFFERYESTISDVSVSSKKKSLLQYKEDLISMLCFVKSHQFDEIADTQLITFRQIDRILQGIFDDLIFLQI